MKNSRFATGMLAMAVLMVMVFAPGAAVAKGTYAKFCNKSKHEVVKYTYAYLSPRNKGWVVKGWFALKRRKCAKVFAGNSVYVYVFGAVFKRGKLDGSWGGGRGHRRICVKSTGSFFTKVRLSCPKQRRGQIFPKFRRLTCGHGDCVFNFR